MTTSFHSFHQLLHAERQPKTKSRLLSSFMLWHWSDVLAFSDWFQPTVVGSTFTILGCVKRWEYPFTDSDELKKWCLSDAPG